MIIFRLLALGGISAAFVGCCCNTQTTQASFIAMKPNVIMGGFPGWLANGSASTQSAVCTAPDSTQFAEERERGPVMFEVPLEKNFVPSCKDFRPFKKEKCEGDPIPCAIEKEMDRGRSARIKRLVN